MTKTNNVYVDRVIVTNLRTTKLYHGYLDTTETKSDKSQRIYTLKTLQV